MHYIVSDALGAGEQFGLVCVRGSRASHGTGVVVCARRLPEAEGAGQFWGGEQRSGIEKHAHPGAASLTANARHAIDRTDGATMTTAARTR